MTTPPIVGPSIWEAAHMVDARRPRSLQTELGASDTTCARRAGYILHRIAPTDDPDRRRMLLGTYAHKGLLDAARSEYRWLVERLLVGGGIVGHPDVVQLDAATAGRLPVRLRPIEAAEVCTLEDLKTKSTLQWDRVLAYGPTEAELRQAYLYAWMLRTWGFANVPGQWYLARLGPIDVRRIRFRFLCRDNGEEWTREVAYDEQRAVEAREWVTWVRGSRRPEDLPRDFTGPILSPICDGCPFVSRCWPDVEGGYRRQSALVVDDADRAKALAEYELAREEERAAAKRKEFARAKLDGTPAGIYGGHKLAWRGGKAETEPDPEALVDWIEYAGNEAPMIPDVPEMVAALGEAGIPVPTRPTGRRTSRIIHVTRLPTPEAEAETQAA